MSVMSLPQGQGYLKSPFGSHNSSSLILDVKIIIFHAHVGG
jgi:hypothetical protein